MFYLNLKNSLNGLKNFLSFKIRRHKSLLAIARRILAKKNVWHHMRENSPEVDIDWAEKTSSSLLIISDENGPNYENFVSIRRYFSDVDIVPIFNCMEQLGKKKYDGVIVCIQHHTTVERQRYSELLIALYSIHKNVYPSLIEGAIYENKRCLADVLSFNGISMPSTTVINRLEEYYSFERTGKLKFPVILKSSMGAGASGVIKVEKIEELRAYARMVFGRGLNRPQADYREKEWDYLIVQEFIPGIKEFRVIKIGTSWFAHEKVAGANGFHSGSGNASWISPDLKLMDFCEAVSNKLNIGSAAFDIFETLEGNYLVNEIQCWFGSYSPSQMYINGKPGRYVKKNNAWVFEEGIFNVYGGALLRAMSLINKKEF